MLRRERGYITICFDSVILKLRVSFVRLFELANKECPTKDVVYHVGYLDLT